MRLPFAQIVSRLRSNQRDLFATVATFAVARPYNEPESAYGMSLPTGSTSSISCTSTPLSHVPSV